MLQVAQLEQQLGAATAALGENTAQAGERAAEAAALQQELNSLQAQVRGTILVGLMAYIAGFWDFW